MVKRTRDNSSAKIDDFFIAVPFCKNVFLKRAIRHNFPDSYIRRKKCPFFFKKTELFTKSLYFEGIEGGYLSLVYHKKESLSISAGAAAAQKYGKFRA